jgi:hypothetical protein
VLSINYLAAKSVSILILFEEIKGQTNLYLTIELLWILFFLI